MEKNIVKYKNLSWPLKIGIIGGFIYSVVGLVFFILGIIAGIVDL